MILFFNFRQIIIRLLSSSHQRMSAALTIHTSSRQSLTRLNCCGGVDATRSAISERGVALPELLHHGHYLLGMGRVACMPTDSLAGTLTLVHGSINGRKNSYLLHSLRAAAMAPCNLFFFNNYFRGLNS